MVLWNGFISAPRESRSLLPLFETNGLIFRNDCVKNIASEFYDWFTFEYLYLQNSYLGNSGPSARLVSNSLSFGEMFAASACVLLTSTGFNLIFAEVKI